MSTVLSLIGLGLVVVAGLVHILIFAIESLYWRSHSTWRQFGIRSASDAEVARPWAFNQGFYNLFLAAGAIGGGIGGLVGGGAPWVAIAVFVALSMVAAAVVLVASSRGAFFRGALTQGLIPLVGLLALTGGWLLG